MNKQSIISILAIYVWPHLIEDTGAHQPIMLMWSRSFSHYAMNCCIIGRSALWLSARPKSWNTSSSIMKIGHTQSWTICRPVNINFYIQSVRKSSAGPYIGIDQRSNSLYKNVLSSLLRSFENRTIPQPPTLQLSVYLA